ncbi:glycosyltransferase [Pseudothioclava arenosa]|uniref:Glycosyltransferase n=1 Tax=Pseudothioclava arenosa TaxID=1795308 RepID=A0A2A4CQ90_9RHOB|nr:glycosyltransferase [Pseudothioclava arenosa]PCD76448.1 glycosyltransferase [Pseudothioclava arenosa]
MHNPDPTAKPRLVAVVVTRDRLAQLRVTLPRLMADLPGALDAVVVVDNASGDGTAEWLRTQAHPALHILRQEQNTGGAGGFAAGIAAAQSLFDPDWIVVMDDDARPEPGALAAFHALETQGAEAVAAAVYYPDGRICEMNRPSGNPFWQRAAFWGAATRGRAGFHIGDAAYSALPCEIDVTSFVGFFISRAGLARAGLPDADLFLYGDDAIYTLGLRARGGRILFAPQIRFAHDCSTFAPGERRFRPLWKAYYYQRNLLILYRMAAGAWFWPVLCVILPRWLMRIRAHRGARRAFLRLTLAALADGLRGRRDRRHAEVLHLAETRD